MGVKAGIYTRLSQDREGETSRERQEADCRALCAVRGWEVEEVWTDLLSGYRADVRRPGYEEGLRALAAGKVDVLVVWKLDRLTRGGVKEISRVLEALDAGGGKLASVQDSVDTSTAMGEGVLALLGSVAKQESENTSLRTRSAKAAKARRGEPNKSGRRPFGWEKDWVTPRESEVALIGEAADRVLNGESLLSVARDWEARKIATPAGGFWAASSLSRILSGARVRGLREHNGTVVGPGTWAPVLPAETLERLDVLFAGRAGRRVARSYLLTGLVRCGVCGGTLTPRMKGGDNRRLYRCVRAPGRPRNCGTVVVGAQPLEDFVARVVVAAVSERALFRVDRNTGKPGETRAGLEESRQRLRELQDAYFVEGALEKGRFQVLSAGLVEKIDRLEAELYLSAAAEMVAEVPVDVGAAWVEWDLDRRKKLVAAFFPRIIVGKVAAGEAGKRFNPGRVSLVDSAGEPWSWSRSGPADPETLWSGKRVLPLL